MGAHRGPGLACLRTLRLVGVGRRDDLRGDDSVVSRAAGRWVPRRQIRAPSAPWLRLRAAARPQRSPRRPCPLRRHRAVASCRAGLFQRQRPRRADANSPLPAAQSRAQKTPPERHSVGIGDNPRIAPPGGGGCRTTAGERRRRSGLRLMFPVLCGGMDLQQPHPVGFDGEDATGTERCAELHPAACGTSSDTRSCGRW